MRNSILYPFKFIPIFKERIWGGDNIKKELGIDSGNVNPCGEAWMLSGLDSDDSLVANGFLEGNTLSEILEVYMGELVGEKNYAKFGCLFPLLFKWIDAQDDLSVQVHPDDKMAIDEDESLGKTEMWYVRKARSDAKLICGFKDGVNEDLYLKSLNEHRIERVLKSYSVKEGDVFYIPSGSIHALRKGSLVAEIQQSSDTTYRVYDWDRKDKDGKERGLQIEKALKALKFNQESGIVNYIQEKNKTTTLVNCEHFYVGLILLTQEMEKDVSDLDSFIVYMCTAGRAALTMDGKVVEIKAGEIVLIPASAEKILLFPDVNGCEMLETYIPQID